MGMRLPKELEAEILARADNVGPCAAMPEGLPVERSGSVIESIGSKEWTFRVDNWTPTPLNKILYGRHWTTGAKYKKGDGEIIAHYGRHVPKANLLVKRSVALHVVFPPKKRTPDVDAFAKSLLDALVSCGLLHNDSDKWCRLEPVSYSRGEALVTFITLREILQ